MYVYVHVFREKGVGVIVWQCMGVIAWVKLTVWVWLLVRVCLCGCFVVCVGSL